MGGADVGDGSLEGGGDRLLVGGVPVGMKKTDRDRLDAGAFQLRGQLAKFGRFRMPQDGSVEESALGCAEAERAGDKRLARGGRQVVEFGAILPPDVEDVLEAGGGDERGAGPFVFEERVCRDGRAVDDFGARRSGGSGDALQDYLGWIAGIGTELECFKTPAGT